MLVKIWEWSSAAVVGAAIGAVTVGTVELFLKLVGAN